MPFTRFVILMLAIVLFGASAAVAQTGHREQIAATVNDDVITTTDIKTRLRLNTGGRPIPENEQARAFNVILDELITEALQKQEARALNVNVEQEQLDQAFARVAQQNEVSAEEFRGRMQQAGVPPEALYKKLETEIAWSQVVRRKLRPQVSISERDIDAVFDDMERSTAEPQFRVAEIFLKKGDDAENRMKDLMRKIVNREIPFPEAAQQYSEAPGASRGGDLGWMTMAQMDPHLQPVIKEMQKGQLSPLIESEAGYHVVLLIDSRDAKAAAEAGDAPSKTDEEARERVANQLGMQRIDALQKRYLQDLRAAAYIDRRI